MASTVKYQYTAEELIADLNKDDNREREVKRAPTNVSYFFAQISGIIDDEYVEEIEGADGKKLKKMKTDGQNFLKALYRRIVFQGQEFKEQIPRIGSAAKDSKKKFDAFPDWVDCGTEILTHAGTLLAYVIRGEEGNSEIKSEVFELADNRAVAVCTFKMIQAIVTIMMVSYNLAEGLEPAKLGANVNAACKIPESKADKQNWAIHGHSGLNFVANYVQKLTSKNHPRAKKFPSLDNILMMAWRMDQSQKVNLGKIGSKTLYPTVEAIFRTTGMTSVDLEKMSKILKNNEKNWGQSSGSLSANLAKQFMSNFTIAEMDSKKGGRNEASNQNVEDIGGGID